MQYFPGKFKVAPARIKFPHAHVRRVSCRKPTFGGFGNLSSAQVSSTCELQSDMQRTVMTQAEQSGRSRIKHARGRKTYTSMSGSFVSDICVRKRQDICMLYCSQITSSFWSMAFLQDLLYLPVNFDI